MNDDKSIMMLMMRIKVEGARCQVSGTQVPGDEDETKELGARCSLDEKCW